jgi:hypothetical protein
MDKTYILFWPLEKQETCYRLSTNPSERYLTCTRSSETKVDLGARHHCLSTIVHSPMLSLLWLLYESRVPSG